MATPDKNPILLALEAAKAQGSNTLPCCVLTNPDFTKDLETIKSWFEDFGASETAELIGLTLTCCR